MGSDSQQDSKVKVFQTLQRGTRRSAACILITLLIIMSAIIYYHWFYTRIAEYTGSLHLPRADHSAIQLRDGRALIIGGVLTGQQLSFTELFDPGESRFTPAALLNIGRGHSEAVLLDDGRVLVVGDNGHPQRAEIYDPKNNTFFLT